MRNAAGSGNWNREEAVMHSSFVGKTDAEVTEVFGRIFEHHVPPGLDVEGRAADRRAAVEELAKLYMTTPVTLDVRQNREKRLAGSNVTGTVYETTCAIIEKMEAYGLEIGDERIWWHTARLRQESEDRLRADIERREREFAGRVEAARAAIEAQREDLRVRESGIGHEKADLEARERRVAERERDVGRWEAAAAHREERRSVILEEMREGGLLGASPIKSLYLARLELEADDERADQEARTEAVARIEKERVFNILTYPVRGLLAIFMP